MRIRKKGIAMLTVCLVLGTPVRAAAQVTYYNYGSDGGGTDLSSYADGEEDRWNGPGVADRVTEEEEAGSPVPGVKEVTLSEQYHEEYGTYEESMAGLFFIYSNVGNGGFSDLPVYVDIPANLTWTMEKDGIPMEYASGQTVGEKGTYVLKLSGVTDPELPLSMQTEYRAVFRFRIQEKAPAAETEESGQESRQPEISGFYGSGTGGWQEQMEETMTAEGAGEGTESGETMENGGVKPEAGEPEEESGTGGEPEEGLTQSYNPSTGRYDMFTAGGSRFSSTVPHGTRGCREAVLYLEEGTEFTLYRDGEMVEYVSGNVVKDKGDYRLETGGSVFAFSVGAYVNRENLYTAPLGMTVSRLACDGEAQTVEHDRYVSMDRDGAYDIFLTGETGETMEITLIRDSIQPEAELDISRGSASVLRMSEDVESAVLIRDGGEPEELRGTQIRSPGTYRLILTDRAGNENSYEFSLHYQMNLYAVFAVVLMIALIAGGIVFVRYTKKNMKIR